MRTGLFTLSIFEWDLTAICSVAVMGSCCINLTTIGARFGWVRVLYDTLDELHIQIYHNLRVLAARGCWHIDLYSLLLEWYDCCGLHKGFKVKLLMQIHCSEMATWWFRRLLYCIVDCAMVFKQLHDHTIDSTHDFKYDHHHDRNCSKHLKENRNDFRWYTHN